MENSKISWTTHTYNHWIGCTKVSAGCKFCYAEELIAKRWKSAEWGVHGTRVKTKQANKPLLWDKKAKAAGERHRVFTASLADVFEDHPTIDPTWRSELWELIEATPNLDWLVLTKRPENIIKMTPERWNFPDTINYEGWPSNVWIGTSVENQETADERVPELLKINAAVRFLSVEPLIGAVDLGKWLDRSYDDSYRENYVNWVIVGGESGSNARPFHIEWAYNILEDSKKSGTKFFMKQLGSDPYLSGNKYPIKDRKGDIMEEWPELLRVQEFPIG